MIVKGSALIVALAIAASNASGKYRFDEISDTYVSEDNKVTLVIDRTGYGEFTYENSCTVLFQLPDEPVVNADEDLVYTAEADVSGCLTFNPGSTVEIETFSTVGVSVEIADPGSEGIYYILPSNDEELH